MRRTVLALALVAVVATALGTWVGRGASSDAEELGRRLDASDEPSRFSFEHRAGGTRTLDCFLPNRAVAGTVDYEAGLAVLRDATGTEIARKHQDRVLLHRDLFAEGTVPALWLHLALPPSDELRAPLTATLGTELVGYVLSPGLPPSGRATALAALDAAERVDPLPATTVDDRRSDGYRIVVDADRFAETAPSPEDGAAPGTDLTPPTVDIWIDEGDRVNRVAVLPGRPAVADEEGAGGWSIDYEMSAPPFDVREPTSLSDVTDVELSRLSARPSTGECEVPS